MLPVRTEDQAARLLQDLRGFTGSDQWYRFTFDKRHLLTQGTYYLWPRKLARFGLM